MSPGPIHIVQYVLYVKGDTVDHNYSMYLSINQISGSSPSNRLSEICHKIHYIEYLSGVKFLLQHEVR